MNDSLLSSLDGILFLETATELLEEVEFSDFSFIDSMLLNQNDIDLEDEKEDYPYV